MKNHPGSKAADELACGLQALDQMEKHRRIRLALADVEAGRFVSHEEMLRWAASLQFPASR